MKTLIALMLTLLLTGCALNPYATPEENRARAAAFWQSGDHGFHP